MIQFVRTEVQKMPKVKFIGKRYTEKDKNASGTFSDCWMEWFNNSYFDMLGGVGKGIEGISDDYIGLCLSKGNSFEYWIGLFMSLNDEVPDGFESVYLDEGNIFVCYLKGKEETDELFSNEAFKLIYSEMRKAGYQSLEQEIMFERYNCPRYTCPDKDGNVILDYCIYFK